MEKRAVLYGHLLSADTKWCESGMHLKLSYVTVGALFDHPGVVFYSVADPDLYGGPRTGSDTN